MRSLAEYLVVALIALAVAVRLDRAERAARAAAGVYARKGGVR